MKRNCLFYWFAVLLLLFTSVRSYAEVYSGSCGENVNWTLDTETGLLEITGSGDMKDYSSGDAPWYKYKSNIKECVIENRVTSIGDYAFWDCTRLTSITIPESVTSIGEYAFQSCSQLKTVINYSNLNITKGNSSNGYVAYYADRVIKAPILIGDFLFNESSGGNTLAAYIGNETAITLPNDYKGESYCIGEYAFYKCIGLTSITIGNSVTSIGTYAFNNCTGLTSITIGNSVTSIGTYAFKYCSQLKTIINYSKLNITKGSSSNGYVAYYADRVINATDQIGDFLFNESSEGNTLAAYIGNETAITLPNDYKGESYCIGEYAFYKCTGLTNITIPNSVTSIGEYAFHNCTGLTSITIPESVTSIGEYAFQSCSQLKTVINYSNLNITKGSSSNGYVAYYADRVIKAPILIGDFLFNESSEGNTLAAYIGNETAITLPNDYKGESYCIGEYAFYKCTGLTSITIPESVTSIGEYAFHKCTRLTSITIGNSVTSIGSYAFNNCTGLTSITIPNNVTSIGSYAFQSCSQLKTVINCSKLNITKGSSSYGYVACYADKVIKADTQIDDFFFKDRTDGNYLIYYIGDETELTLPENYQGGGYNVGESVFSNYSKLTNIIIPESVTSIGNSAFSGCSGLTSITIPENVTSIGADAFCGCNNLTSIVWNVKSYPDPTSYENSPFYGNIGTVQEIIFGEGITSIPKYLCKGMSNLKTVTFPQSLTSIRHYAFDGCTGLTEITLPENVNRIGPNALAGCTNIKTIYCRSQEPPVCGNSALDGIDTWDCTLFVPEGAEALYKAADQWKEFFFIEEITGIDTPKTDNGKDTTYDIYDMNGRLVRKAATTTDGLKAGLYIINGRKVLVK